MCVFCAAIPVAVGIEVSARKSQNEKAILAEGRGEKPPKNLVPAGPATAAVVTSLAIASFIYHTHASPIYF